MKYLHYIILIAFICGCNPNNKTEIVKLTRQYSIEDLIELKIEQSEIGNDFEPILDSVINWVTKCDHYKNMQLGFIVTAYTDSINMQLIRIENITRLYEFDYTGCSSMFFYKGYRFACIGKMPDPLIKSLDQTINIFFIDPEKLQFMDKGRNEFFYSSWTYVYENNSFNCVSYNNCGSFWNNETNH